MEDRVLVPEVQAFSLLLIQVVLVTTGVLERGEAPGKVVAVAVPVVVVTTGRPMEELEELVCTMGMCLEIILAITDGLPAEVPVGGNILLMRLLRVVVAAAVCIQPRLSVTPCPILVEAEVVIMKQPAIITIIEMQEVADPVLCWSGIPKRRL